MADRFGKTMQVGEPASCVRRLRTLSATIMWEEDLFTHQLESCALVRSLCFDILQDVPVGLPTGDDPSHRQGGLIEVEAFKRKYVWVTQSVPGVKFARQ